MAQAIALAKRPHVVVGTPGRVKDHLTNTKVCPLMCETHFACSAPDAIEISQGFSLRQLQHLVLDEADRILSLDFEEELDQILQACTLCVASQIFVILSLTSSLCAGHPARALHATV